MFKCITEKSKFGQPFSCICRRKIYKSMLTLLIDHGNLVLFAKFLLIQNKILIKKISENIALCKRMKQKK